MDEFTLEKSFISTQMKKFKILFDKEADENLDLFLKYSVLLIFYPTYYFTA